MAKIKLQPEAALAVSNSMKGSGEDLAKLQCGQFFERRSDSPTMDLFEVRVAELRSFLETYRELLADDIAALDKACGGLISRDEEIAADIAGSSGGESARSMSR